MDASLQEYHTRKQHAPAKAEGFDVKKLSGKVSQFTMLALALLVAAGGVHVMLMQAEAKAQDNANAVQQLFAQSQRTAMMTADYESSHNEASLDKMKEAATTVVTMNNIIAPQMATAAGQQANAVITGFTDQALVYGAMAQQGGEDAAQKASQLIATAENDIPATWMPAAQQMLQQQSKNIQLMDYGTLGIYGLLALLVLTALPGVIKPAIAQIALQNENIEHMSTTDMLTGLYNRSMLFKIATMLMSGALRHDRGLAVLVIDIDNFKEVNDTFGRTMGDATIRTVGATMGGLLRSSDVIGRVGGTEFAAFLPSTDEYRATFVAEKLRSAIEKMEYSIKDRVILLRVSIGVAQMEKGQHKNPAEMLLSAEAALKHAKANGRNCIVTQSNMQVVHVKMPATGEDPAAAPPEEYAGQGA